MATLHLVPASLLALAVAGCASADVPTPSGAAPEELTFPEQFLFGSAIAGFQADMGCPTMPASACVDSGSDWYVFATDPGLVADPGTYLSGQDPAVVGPGHWELYESDFDLAENDLHHTSLRTSIEWSRIFPTATDGIEGYDALSAVADPDAVAHYHAVFAAMKARGLAPLVTLNHYALPLWIHDVVACHADLDTCPARGWLDSERTIREIAKYAGFCAREFGADVDTWATLNEPFAVVLPGYIYPSAERSNPPAVALKFDAAKTVLSALVEGHARMYDAVKESDQVDADGDGAASRVGLVYPMTPFAPKNPAEPLDVQGAENAFYLWNMVYLNGVVKGDLDADLDGTAEHRDDLAGRMDYLGVNYYTRATVEGTNFAYLPDLSPLTTFNLLTIQLWEEYPRGIYDMLTKVRDDFGLPTVVTETGVADPNDDGAASRWVAQTLTWVSRAIADGADVRGYHYWTLMDNFEWNHGMEIRMGLYAVDKGDPAKARTARSSVATYGRIAGEGRVAPDLQAQYPAPR